MTKPKIYITGGSWARGEWSDVKPIVQHKGIEQYFLDDSFQVVNKSRPRTYHLTAVDMISNSLHNEFTPGDYVFFIITDPLLDILQPELVSLKYKKSLTSVHTLPNFTKTIKEAGGFNLLVKKVQHQIYNRINNLGKLLDTKIHCIGGSFNLNTDIISEYQNLNPIVPSWVKLLVGHYDEYKDKVNDPEFGIINTWGIDYIDLTQYNKDFAEQVKQEFDNFSKNRVILTETIFHPDGNHPNREGHRILYDYIRKELNI